MKPEKLRKLQKTYKPEVCLNLKGYKCILSDRLYIPNEFVDDEMMENFTTQLGIIEMERDEFGDDVEIEKEIRGYKEYPNVTAFHRGNLGKLDETFLVKLNKMGAKIVDIRARPKMINDIEFTGTLKDDQKRVQKEWLEYGYGIIKAPPRYGKTILLCSLLCKLHKKTLVIVHQHELIKQFRKALKNFTNAFDFEDGVSIIKSKNIKDMAIYDICITTWQLLNAKNGKKALRKYRNAFGLVIVDEVHKSSAPCFKSVVSKLNSYYRCGCTATDKRKDMMEPVVYDIIGPVVTHGKMNKVPVNVFIHKTGFDPKLSGNFLWCTLEKRLASSKSRNDLICQQIKKDIKENKHYYGVVMTRPVFHVKLLVKKLNKMGIETAGFWGGAFNREKLLEDMFNGKYRVIVANRAMLLGINIPRWTNAYNVMPSANAPNWYQEMSRVRTPYTITWTNKTGETKTWKKKIAIVHDYVDAFGPAIGCLNVRRKVYEKDKKIRVIWQDNTDNDACGKCKSFNYCTLQGKSIKYDTPACIKFSKKIRRFGI